MAGCRPDLPRILILEGNTPELALGAQKALGRTAAQGFGAALKAEAPGVEFTVAAPYFDDFDPAAYDLSAFDGMAVTGSGVAWSGADERARPFWDMFERAFKAGTPAFGSCWGMQTAAVALGGVTEAGPNGVEAGVARAVRPLGDHPMTAGRRAAFDVVAMHRDDVTQAPEGAVVTAMNDHTAVQAFAYERDGVDFWGVQYHPECWLDDAAFWLSRPGSAWSEMESAETRLKRAEAMKRVAADPAHHVALAVKHGINLDLLDRAYHRTELGNWLRCKIRRA